MNLVTIIGRLTREVNLRFTQSGKAIASFTVAVNRITKNADGKNEADFFPVVAWNKTAESCMNYLDKGSKVAVHGRLQTRNYDDKEGVKRYVTEIIANDVEFLDTKKSGQAPGQSPTHNEPPTDDSIPF